MKTQAFYDGSIKPTDHLLREVFANAFFYYDELNRMTKTFSKEWKFYNNGGWIEKVFDKKKALFYFLPLLKSFKVSMTIREKERTIFLQDHHFDQFQSQLKTAKKYPEGYALQFLIEDESSFNFCKPLLEQLIEIRNKSH